MKILVVDDTRTARYAMRIELQKHGVEVEMADSAESALELLKTQRPDAILMDHIMTGMNGLEALEAIKSDPRTASIPVVMATSQDDPEFAARAYAKGALGILPKSVPSETQARLPEVLAQLRALPAAAPAPMPAVATPVAQPLVPPPSAAPVSTISAEDIERLVAQRAEALLSERLPMLLDQLRRDLTASLQADTRQLLDTRLHELRASLPHPPGPAEIQSLIDRAFAARPEPLGMQTVIDQAVQTGSASLEHRLAALDDVLSSKAQQIARRESQAAMEQALAASQQVLDTLLETRLRASLNQMYLPIAGAALAGIAAAALVYLLG